MEIEGRYLIAASRQEVWDALVDPSVLKKCIPGCESLEKLSDNEFTASIRAVIGPVRATYVATISLQDLAPPESYTLRGNAKSGAAGFGNGSARVNLVKEENSTSLRFVAEFQVGGKLAQVGSRLVAGVTRKLSDEFFGKLSKEFEAEGAGLHEAPPSARQSPYSKAALLAAAIVLGLLLWWFLQR